MYKNFILTESEKEQILNMHKGHGYGKPLNEIGFGAYDATQQAGKTPVQTTVSPESKTIADKLRNSVGYEEFLNDVKLIKSANQFWEVDAAIRKFRAERPDYGFESLANSGGNLEIGVMVSVAKHLKSIGIQSTPVNQFSQSIEIVSKPTVVKQQWVKNNGFPLKFGQMTEKYPNGIIGKFQVALNAGMNGDGYFGQTTENKIKVKFPQYKRETGVTEEMYNTIVKNVAVGKDLKTTYDMNTQAGKDAYLQQGMKTTPTVNPAAKYSQITPQQQANANALKSGQPLVK
jgi:hypothetical protein